MASRKASSSPSTQTHDGYLWLGTLNGLVRFDGNAFTPFNVNNTPDLPDNRILFLFEDSRSNLWVDTANAGLCLIHNGQVKRFDAAVGERITSAFEDQSGTVWFDSVAGNADNWLRWQNGTLAAHAPRCAAGTAPSLQAPPAHGPRRGSLGIEEGAGVAFPGRPFGTKLEHHESLSPVRWSLRGPLGALNIDREVTAAVEDPGGNLVRTWIPAFTGLMALIPGGTLRLETRFRIPSWRSALIAKATCGSARMAAAFIASPKRISTPPLDWTKAWPNQWRRMPPVVCGSPSMPRDSPMR